MRGKGEEENKGDDGREMRGNKEIRGKSETPRAKGRNRAEKQRGER